MFEVKIISAFFIERILVFNLHSIDILLYWFTFHVNFFYCHVEMLFRCCKFALKYITIFFFAVLYVCFNQLHRILISPGQRPLACETPRVPCPCSSLMEHGRARGLTLILTPSPPMAGDRIYDPRRHDITAPLKP